MNSYTSKKRASSVIVQSKYFKGRSNDEKDDLTNCNTTGSSIILHDSIHDNANTKRTKTMSTKTFDNENIDTKQKRTNSFQPLFHEEIPVHTLILGTHPSIKSLSENQYFGHPMNAFWWIAGDCLGFRRADGISKSNGKPYKFTADLRYGMECILSYDEQVETLLSKGFALWDVVANCERKGSLDADIKYEKPNDIRGFCKKHKTIKRELFVVLASSSVIHFYICH